MGCAYALFAPIVRAVSGLGRLMGRTLVPRRRGRTARRRRRPSRR